MGDFKRYWTQRFKISHQGSVSSSPCFWYVFYGISSMMVSGSSRSSFATLAA